MATPATHVSSHVSTRAKKNSAHGGNPPQRALRIVRRTVRAFFEDNIGQLGAALAFYTTVAVAPLLVIAIAVAGFVFDQDAARQTVLGEIQHLAGSQTSAALATLQNPLATRNGAIATVIGTVTLIFGAIGVFEHLQDALNTIWRTHPHPEKGWWRLLRRRIFSLATVIVTGFLLLVSLIASAALSWLGAKTVSRLGLPAYALEMANTLLSFLVVSFLFGMIFKLLPDTRVRWRNVWAGAAVTGLLFTLGKNVLGLYLGRASVTSAYGAAGSLMVLLLWCYYAAQIVFFGAEFTRVTSLSDAGRDFTPLDAQGERSITASADAPGSRSPEHVK